MNLSDMHQYKAAVATEEALRISGGTGGCKYNRLSTAAVRRLKKNASDHTANEWATKLDATPNTIRHRCKALGVTLKPFTRH